MKSIDELDTDIFYEIKQKYNKLRGVICKEKIEDEVLYHYDLIDDGSDRYYPCGLKYKSTTSSLGYTRARVSRIVYAWVNFDHFFKTETQNSDQEISVRPCKKCIFTSFDKVDEQFFKDILFSIRRRPEPVRQFMREYMKHRFGDGK